MNIDNTLSNLSVFSLLVFTSDSLSSTTVESSDVFSAISLMPSAVSDTVIFTVFTESAILTMEFKSISIWSFMAVVLSSKTEASLLYCLATVVKSL